MTIPLAPENMKYFFYYEMIHELLRVRHLYLKYHISIDT